MPQESDHALIRHLKRAGWTTAQIAEYVGQERDTILQVVRERPTAEAPAQPATRERSDPALPLQLRLSRDARRLELLLPVGAVPTPTAVLLAQIHAHCSQHHITAALTHEALDERLRVCVYGSWLTILDAVPPTPPTHGRVRVLVPVTVAALRSRGTSVTVREGTVLARREAGQPGQPGRDLRGRALPPRPPRAASLPQGENTRLSADGTALVAACDGVAVLRHLRLHVLPMTIHEGDLTGADGMLRAAGGVIVTGSVREGGVLAAEGDVEIQGGVQASQVTTTSGRIAVAGAVGGTAHQPGVLQAAGAITCARVQHGVLRAGGDIVVRSDVHHSTLQAAGNLYVPRALDHCLYDVQLSVSGGVVAPVAPLVPLTESEAPRERQHTRIPLTMAAHIAIHGAPPFVFTPCTIEDLSPGGARCRLTGALAAATLAPDTIVQLKIVLPGRTEHSIILARVVRIAGPEEIGLAFLQITERDADRVMQFCLQQLRAHKNLTVGTPADRRGR